MLFSSDYDGIVDPIRSLIVYLTIAMVIGAYLIGIYVLAASRNPEKNLSSKYFIGIGSFSILFGTGRLIFMIHDYFVPDYIGRPSSSCRNTGWDSGQHRFDENRPGAI